MNATPKYEITFGTSSIADVPQTRAAAIALAETLDCNNTEEYEITVWENGAAIFQLHTRS